MTDRYDRLIVVYNTLIDEKGENSDTWYHLFETLCNDFSNSDTRIEKNASVFEELKHYVRNNHLVAVNINDVDDVVINAIVMWSLLVVHNVPYNFDRKNEVFRKWDQYMTPLVCVV